MMRILQISTFDINGGAEKVAWDLHHGYRSRGHNAVLVVGAKRSDASHVVGLAPERGSLAWFRHKLVGRLEYWTGFQAMGYSRFGQWWKDHQHDWDIVHVHNLHSGYFDLAVLPEIARTTPVVQTLHDCWQFTGHCAHPMDCERWKAACGDCPDLTAYPAVRADRTRFNWQRKRKIYAMATPTLVAPSQWLRRKVADSFLGNLRCDVIYNGVDTDRFSPGDQAAARTKLKLPLDKKVLLYVANGGLRATHYKDPSMALNALRDLIYRRGQADVILASVGGYASLPNDIAPYVIQYGAVKGNLEVFYQAADGYLHPTKADNCPLVILEAMACGLPVVTTDVGGCGELVVDGQTGFVVRPGDPSVFATAIDDLLRSNSNFFRDAAVRRVRELFSLGSMLEHYLQLYDEILVGRRRQ